MGLRPTYRDENALLRFIDSKWVTPRLSTEFVMGLRPTYGDEKAPQRLGDSK
jgi:hypothetical protein